MFFRLSLFHPYIYIALVPASCGLFTFIMKKTRNQQPIFMGGGKKIVFMILIVMFLCCLLFDLFQDALTINSLFSVRMMMLVILSLFPAYFLVDRLRGDESNLKKIITLSIWMQIVLFFIMYFSSEAKYTIYTTFGMGDSVNLTEQNIVTRGFGLSSEINFMTPFLMVFITFFILKNKYLLLFMVSVTQIVNSNMTAIAILLAAFFSKINIPAKLLFSILLVVVLFVFGPIYSPRFYDEFVISGGMRTVDALIKNHFFAVDDINWFTLLFGFQQNISSSIPDLDIYSDVGWVIMFNYGGGVFITLFILLLLSLSISAFGKTKLAAIWFLVGLVFNTKGLLLGVNGYMFITFIYIFLRNYKSSNEFVKQVRYRSI